MQSWTEINIYNDELIYGIAYKEENMGSLLMEAKNGNVIISHNAFVFY